MNALDRLTGQAKKEFWASLALRYCGGMSPRLSAKLLRHYGSAYQAYECLSSKQALANIDTFARKVPSAARTCLKNGTWRGKALQEWQDARKVDCEIVLWTDYRYPLALKQIIDAPPFFYARGDCALLSSPALAVVGSRKASWQSEAKAEEIARELSGLGIVIVSGMALGIDRSAHKGALEAQGKTIAVLGTGIDVVYPQKHEELYHSIAEHGLLISEFPPFAQARAQNFPVRNRLITGISEGVLIVEAALKSGSLITARLALEQNKNVYVCRPLTEKHSLGGQKLLEEGALLVDDSYAIVADLVPYLSLQYENLLKNSSGKNSAEERNISDNTALPIRNENSLERGAEKSLAAEHSAKNGTGEENSVKSAQIKNEDLPQERSGTNNARQETHIYPVPSAKKKNKARLLLARPKADEELMPMSLDFGEMAQHILMKENPAKKLGSKKKSASSTPPAPLAAPAPKKKEKKRILQSDNPIVRILAKNGALSADEIMLFLQSGQAETDMAALSSELLLLEVEGAIIKEAGARYRVYDE